MMTGLRHSKSNCRDLKYGRNIYKNSAGTARLEAGKQLMAARLMHTARASLLSMQNDCSGA
jgi:hypothetical protein